MNWPALIRFSIVAFGFVLLTGMNGPLGEGVISIVGGCIHITKEAYEAAAEAKNEAIAKTEAKKRMEKAKSQIEERFLKRLAAARCGDPKQQYWLGIMYMVGTEPAIRDPVVGFKWLSLAAKADYGSAAERKAHFREQLTHHQRTESELMVNDWKPDPASCESAGMSPE